MQHSIAMTSVAAPRATLRASTVAPRPNTWCQHAQRGAILVRAQTTGEQTAVAKGSEKKKSLASKMGGKAAVTAAVDVFYEKMLGDPRVSFFFDGIDMKAQQAHQAAFLTFAMGGSDRYDGNSNMTTAHARLVRDMGMNMEHFDITLTHLASALHDLGKPQELIDQAAETVETLRPAFQEAVDIYGDDNVGSSNGNSNGSGNGKGSIAKSS